jgi:glycosyltransferase involved in cell wall biosynthesis
LAIAKALTADHGTLDVLLATEGTYPYFGGGVSQWCDTMVARQAGVRYHVYSVVSLPYFVETFKVPARTALRRVSLWGTEDPAEILDLPASTLYRRRQKVTRGVVVEEFLPLFDAVLDTIWSPEQDGRAVGDLLYRLYLFFSEYDYSGVFKDGAVWDAYLAGLGAGRWQRGGKPTLADAHTTFGWLYRFLVVLSTPVPKVDLVHSSASAFCGIPGILAKHRYNTPFLVTEHGVYLREQYLSVGQSDLSPFAKHFLMGLVRMVVVANYAHADLVAPVAAYNARWERRLGVPEDRIRVVYNGVDEDSFPAFAERAAGAPPTVAAVARIDPNKDILSLIEAAALVLQERPEVRFVVYGGVSVPSYYEVCRARCEALGLGASFTFAGHTEDMASAYRDADVVVLSSITEGFPYAVIEAMMSGRPVVATDVGGISEAVDGTGVLVPPKAPSELAAGILKLLADPSLRAELAHEARVRALDLFTARNTMRRYFELYQELAARDRYVERLVHLIDRRRDAAVRRGDDLRRAGRYQEAIREYRLAASLDPDAVGTTRILLRVADTYGDMGDRERQEEELRRADLHLWATTRQDVRGGVADVPTTADGSLGL